MIFSINGKRGVSLKIKKIIISVLLFCAALFSLCSCQLSKTREEMNTESELPELKIGADRLKPFFYIDENGEYKGIDAEIAKEACKRAGYRPEFVEISWGDRDDYLQGGSVDCLWSAFIKNGRESDYQWTDSYMQSNLRAIVDSKSPDSSLSTLKGHGGIAVRAGSKIEDILLNDLKDLPVIQIYSCETFEMAETAFIKGYAGALGGHEAVLLQIIDSYPGLYRFLDGNIATADLGVAFSKDDTSDHCEKINKVLNEMKKDGTVEKIIKKYTSDTTSDGEEVPANEKK